MPDKVKSFLDNPIIGSIIGAAMVVGFLFGMGFINTSMADTKPNMQNFVSRSEFSVMRTEDREDKQILFQKIDRLTEQLSEISGGLARLEGKRGSD